MTRLNYSVTDGTVYVGYGIKLTQVDPAERTSASFPFSFQNVEIGEEYIDEFSAKAVDNEGNEYELIWHFTQIKGQEQDDDYLDWDSALYDVKEI